MNTIQQDIRTQIEEIEVALRCAKGNVSGVMTRALFIQAFARQKDLAQLLLRLSNVKMTGLYPFSANESVDTSNSETLGNVSPSINSTANITDKTDVLWQGLGKNGQKIRKTFWSPETYVVVDDDGKIINGSDNTRYLWGRMLATALSTEGRWEWYEDKTNTIADTTHVHEKQAPLPSGRIFNVIDGEIVYTEPKTDTDDHHEVQKVFEEKPKTTGLTFLEATKDGQKARRPHWDTNAYVFFDVSDPHSDYKLYDSAGEFASALTRDDYRANDWEIHGELAKTMTGYEAAKLVMEGKTVKRLRYSDTNFSFNNHPFPLTKENLEATDWVEVVTI